MIMLGLVFFVGGVVCLLWSYSHMLSVLLSFEMMMLGLLAMMCMWFLYGVSELFFILCFIVIMVGESVLGLSVLVSMVRWFGEEGYFSFNSL